MIFIYTKIITNLKEILVALGFLTLIPIPQREKIEMGSFARSMAYYPLVGLLIGFILFSVYFLLRDYFSPLLIMVLVTGIWARGTGSLHLEGFVDAVDGFSAGPDRERILSVMKDPNCGSKGVVALVFLIFFKIAILMDIPDDLIFHSLLIAPAISRWSMVSASFFCDYARNKGGLGKPFVENVGIREFIISCSIVLIAGLVLLQTQFIAVMIAPICFTIAAILYLKKRLGGITGDVLGALNELMEVVSLSSFLFFW
ncbi:MAG: adenosylcobinamide-GDP ribazoletransferase [Spirochaetota bacterium]|nr:adenosylcobinamide-GDP ribazoletransferase [Spirochaetota bacterium]